MWYVLGGGQASRGGPTFIYAAGDQAARAAHENCGGDDMFYGAQGGTDASWPHVALVTALHSLLSLLFHSERGTNKSESATPTLTMPCPWACWRHEAPKSQELATRTWSGGLVRGCAGTSNCQIHGPLATLPFSSIGLCWPLLGLKSGDLAWFDGCE